jgi:hypothetical protein
MNEIDAKRIFDHQVALSYVFGGELKRRCLELGVPEQTFEKLLKEHQRLSAFVDKHDSLGNITKG